MCNGVCRTAAARKPDGLWVETVSVSASASLNAPELPAGRQEREKSVAGVMQKLYRSVVVKTELKIKEKLLISWLTRAPSACGHKLVSVTERMR